MDKREQIALDSHNLLVQIAEKLGIEVDSETYRASMAEAAAAKHYRERRREGKPLPREVVLEQQLGAPSFDAAVTAEREAQEEEELARSEEEARSEEGSGESTGEEGSTEEDGGSESGTEKSGSKAKGKSQEGSTSVARTVQEKGSGAQTSGGSKGSSQKES